MRALWLLAGAVAGMLIAGALLFTLVELGGTESSADLSAPAVVNRVQELREFVTTRYLIQKIVGFEEKKVPAGSEKLLLIVQAEVLAGLDLSAFREGDVIFRDGGIVIRLPRTQILHVIVDDKETKVWDRRVTWWTPWVPYNPDLERQARLAAREAVERAAIEMGILKAGRANAENAIRNILWTAGAKRVEFASGS